LLLCCCSEPDEEVPASVYLAVASVSPRATQEQLDAAEVRQRDICATSAGCTWYCDTHCAFLRLCRNFWIHVTDSA
jgi:hypothetical protein